jgi:UDP-N-acetylmuramyl pentapeptide phosphotransferase/UDP-N-acetylglucosamine-1-phosphate transferase
VRLEPLTGALVAFLIAFVGTRLAERVARGRSLLDVPNERSSHVVPTPRIGGLGIATGTLAGWVLMQGPSDPTALVIVAACLLLATVGLLDDVRHISVATKYLAQLATAAVAAVAISPRLSVDVAGLGLVVDGVPAIVLTTIWLTAMINAFNFMDGIDGLVGSVAAIASLIGLGLVVPEAQPLLVAVAGACVGFLVWNQAPASIFMGDVGSQFLGLAVGAGLLRQASGTVAVLPVVLLVAPLMFDTGFTLIRRWRAGKDVLAGHREHLYQRLATGGRSHREVAAGYACATVIVGLIALAWGSLPAWLHVGAIVLLGVAGALYVRWVVRLEAAVAGSLPGSA